MEAQNAEENYLFSKRRNLDMAERKAVIKNADMSEDMQQDAVDCASQALEKYNIEKVNYNHIWLCQFPSSNCYTICYRILLRTLRRNSTRNITPRGTVL